MAKFYSGNHAQNVVEAKEARHENGWKEVTRLAIFEGRPCIEVWWESRDGRRAPQLARRIFK